mgnify:FL=1
MKRIVLIVVVALVAALGLVWLLGRGDEPVAEPGEDAVRGPAAPDAAGSSTGEVRAGG